MDIPKVRQGSTVRMSVSLTDNGVKVDWRSLDSLSALIYSDSQRAIAGAASIEIDKADTTSLLIEYAGYQPQYDGIARLIIRCLYKGAEKTFDAPVCDFVSTTAEATGITVINDPELDVHLTVTEVSTSILDAAIAAAFDGASEANTAAEAATTAAQAATDAASGATAAINDANAAAIAANSATKSATEATENLVAAGESATNATVNANNAASLARDAAQSVEAVKTAAQAATKAANTAADSATTAANDASKAAQSATNAAGALQSKIDSKQDTISDLETIRSNAKNASDTIAIMIEAGYVFSGVATPSTNPETPNAKAFYIANGKGTYTNFGDIEVMEDEVVVLYYDTAWHKEATGIASQAKLSELELKVDELEKRPVVDETLTKRVANLEDVNRENKEAFIENMDNLGDVRVKSVDMDELPKVSGYPLFVFGSGAPTVAPDFVPQFYIDTTGHKIYIADGTANASSFRILN